MELNTYPALMQVNCEYIHLAQGTSRNIFVKPKALPPRPKPKKMRISTDPWMIRLLKDIPTLAQQDPCPDKQTSAQSVSTFEEKLQIARARRDGRKKL